MKLIPFLDLSKINQSLRKSLDAAYKRVMDSGWFVMGPELTAFEAEFAQYSEVKHCIGVGNGLEALHLLLRAYEIERGDEVIVPSNTFIATWLAVSQCGATPVPVEPNTETHNIEAESIEKVITKRTRMIMPVHLYGQTVDMDSINELAERHGLIVIEDAAQAQGARYKGRCAGSLGHGAATSFYPGKNLGALGDGGAVLTNDDVIAEKIIKLRNYGSKAKYEHELAGYNSRLDEMQAAFLREKLKVLNEWNRKRKSIADFYFTHLVHQKIIMPVVPSDMEPVWHLFVIRCKQRDALKEYLESNGVSTVIHYPIPPHRQKCYENMSENNYPVADRLANEVLSLPISPVMEEDEAKQVVDLIYSFFNR